MTLVGPIYTMPPWSVLYSNPAVRCSTYPYLLKEHSALSVRLRLYSKSMYCSGSCPPDLAFGRGAAAANSPNPGWAGWVAGGRVFRPDFFTSMSIMITVTIGI